MSKIVIDARESGTSTGRYIDKLVEHLHILEPKHEIILLAKAHRLEYLATIAPSFITVETPFKEFTVGEQLGFKGQIEGLEPDLVHFGMVQQPVFYKGQVVTTMHDLITTRFKNPIKNPIVFTLKQQVYKWVNKRVARKSSIIITPTQFVKEDVADYTHVNPDKITVTYESADFITDTPVPVDSLIDRQFIMYVGRPTPHKNLGRLIDAFAILQKTNPELRLALVGKKDANHKRHEAKIHERGIKNVVFTDFISDAQLRWMFESCQAYVFPSLSEGFGLPGLEAMAHGAPVASSNASCLPEVYGDGAHYFDPFDPSDMASKISEVLTDQALRTSLITAGKARAVTYSWSRMAKQTLQIYEDVLQNLASR
jgi:glycosyltransferase involved in cell wall biosynthesis